MGRRLHSEGCLRKVAFGTRAEAEARAAHLRVLRARGSALVAYRCRFCDAYHVGNDDRLRREP